MYVNGRCWRVITQLDRRGSEQASKSANSGVLGWLEGVSNDHEESCGEEGKQEVPGLRGPLE